MNQKNKKRNVTKAFTTSAIIAGGLAIPMAHGVAHADEVTNENSTNIVTSNENSNSLESNTPSSKEIVDDVSKIASAENKDITQPEMSTSNETNVEPVQAPKEEITQSNEVEQPKEETTQSNEVEQPKEETTESNEVAPKEETTQSNKVEQPKEETTQSNEVEQPKEETTETNEVEQSKEETTESNKVEQLKEETTQSEEIEQSKEETTESNTVKQPKEETTETKEIEQPKEETTESKEIEQPKEETTQSNKVEQSKEKTTQSNKVEQPKEETTESNEVEQPESETTESNTVEQSKKESTETNTVEQPKEETTEINTNNANLNQVDGEQTLNETNTTVSPFGIIDANVNETTTSNTPKSPSDSRTNVALNQPVTSTSRRNIEVNADAETPVEGEDSYLNPIPFKIYDLPSGRKVMFDEYGKPTSNADAVYIYKDGYRINKPYTFEDLGRETPKYVKGTKTGEDSYGYMMLSEKEAPLHNLVIDVKSDKSDFSKLNLTGTLYVNGEPVEDENLVEVDEYLAKKLIDINYTTDKGSNYQTHLEDEFIPSFLDSANQFTNSSQNKLNIKGMYELEKNLGVDYDYSPESTGVKQYPTVEYIGDDNAILEDSPVRGRVAVTNWKERIDELVNNGEIQLSDVAFKSDYPNNTYLQIKATSTDPTQKPVNDTIDIDLSNYKPNVEITYQDILDMGDVEFSEFLFDYYQTDFMDYIKTSSATNKGVEINQYNNLNGYKGIYSTTITVPFVNVDETVKTTEREETLPYNTLKRENPDLIEGTRNVIQEGKNGKVIIETVTKTDGTTTDIQRVIEDKVDEIVEIGTGKATEVTSTTTESVDFETETRNTDKLAKGERNVIQEGKNGVRTITTVTKTFKGEPVGEPTSTSEITTQPVTEIVEIGTGIVGSDVSTEDVDIPFETEEQETITLPKGETKVVQEGKNGTKRVTTTTPTLDGEPNGEPTITEETITEPVNEIVQVGTGVVSSTTSTEDVTINYDTIIENDPNLAEGERKVVQEGQNGTKRITTVQPTLNGESYGEPEVTDEIITEPVNEIVHVGTGVVADSVTSEEVKVSFETEERENINLPKGETKVVQEGQNGTKRVTTTQPTLNGEPNGEPTITEETIKAPINKIVEIGTGVVDSDVTSEDVVIPFEIEEQETITLPQGETKVIQEGQNGTKRVTTTQPTLNGEPNGEPTTSEETITEPVNEIVQVGTGVVDSDVTSVDETISFDVVRHENPNLPEGTTNVIQKGKDGTKRVTTTQPTLNGEPNGEATITSDIVNTPVTEIIEVGTGVVGTDSEETNRELPFNTIERVNSELPQGTRNVVQEGKVGNERTTTTYETLNGKRTTIKDTDVTITVKPQDRIVEVGSGVEGQNVTVKETVQPYDTITRENPDLPEGFERIAQVGVNGIERTTTTDKTFNGTITDTVSTSEMVQEKVDQIIEVGTGKVGFETKDIPNTTKHDTIKRENPDLPKGETKVVQEGKDGHTIKRIVTPTLNGQPNGKSEVVVITIDEPVDEIIEVGTKEEQTVTPPKDDTPSVEQPKDEQPKEEQPQYPTPDHTHDHDGIHDNTPVEAKQPKEDISVTDPTSDHAGINRNMTHPTKETINTTAKGTATHVVTHEINNGTRVTVNDTTPDRNRVQITEGQDGNLIVTVKPSAKTQNVNQPQAPSVTDETVKELPQTGSEDDGKQAGILASIFGAVGLGFLFRRKKQSDK